jgi:hypothetical protein
MAMTKAPWLPCRPSCRRSLTWDQGSRDDQPMRSIRARHGLRDLLLRPALAVAAGQQREHQRAGCASTSPRAPNLSVHSREDLDAVAAELNARPRKNPELEDPGRGAGRGPGRRSLGRTPVAAGAAAHCPGGRRALSGAAPPASRLLAHRLRRPALRAGPDPGASAAPGRHEPGARPEPAPRSARHPLPRLAAGYGDHGTGHLPAALQRPPEPALKILRDHGPARHALLRTGPR